MLQSVPHGGLACTLCQMSLLNKDIIIIIITTTTTIDSVTAVTL